MSIKSAKELAKAAESVAQNYETLYVMGCFGAPMTPNNRERYSGNHSYNRQTERTIKIKSATPNTFGFDCVNLIKGLLWGWAGDTSRTYGGASYTANGVPDINADQMIRVCKDVTTDFSTIEVGEVVWMVGHIGIYIGDGLAVESTPKWEDGVQVTAVHNIGTKAGYNGRTWSKHGKLPYVQYTGETEIREESSYTMKMRNLKRGCRGEDVRALQILLEGRGYKGKMHEPDGIFGPNTEEAVKLYQKAKKLEVDGIAGPLTLGSLMGV